MSKNHIMFDDTKTSGWCVMHEELEEEAHPLSDTLVYAAHSTCSLAKTEFKGEHVDDYERWSWFVDDTLKEGMRVCFECGEPVPEHIQALVLLAGKVD